MATDKDFEQDLQIRENAERIARNEEAIKRQTEALEQIRDHYYPPPERWWRKLFSFCGKVVCVIVAYLGIAQAVDWIWNTREAQKLAEKYAAIADQLVYGEGDVQGAISCFKKAGELDGGKSEYVMALSFMKGMALVSDFLDNERLPTDAEQVKIDAALAESILLRKLRPDSPMPHVLMAQALILSGEADEAVEAVERAVALAPKRANVHVSACAVHSHAGHVAEARKHLAEAERLDATLPLVPLWKGLLALKHDRDAPTARRCFETAIRRVPRFPLAHQLCARARLMERDPDFRAARASFSRALVLDAKLTNSMLGIAETYEREGKDTLARLWMDRAIAADGNYLPALVARARLSLRTGACGVAERDLTAAIGLAPFRGDLYALRAAVFEKEGDAARAASDRAAADALAEAGERE